MEPWIGFQLHLKLFLRTTTGIVSNLGIFNLDLRSSQASSFWGNFLMRYMSAENPRPSPDRVFCLYPPIRRNPCPPVAKGTWAVLPPVTWNGRSGPVVHCNDKTFSSKEWLRKVSYLLQTVYWFLNCKNCWNIVIIGRCWKDPVLIFLWVRHQGPGQ